MDVAGKIGFMVEAANGSSAVARMMRGWDRSVELAVGAERHYLAIAAGSASVKALAPARVDLSFELDEGTLDRLFAGALTPLQGKLQGLIRSSGSLIDILRFSAILSASVKEMTRMGEPAGAAS